MREKWGVPKKRGLPHMDAVLLPCKDGMFGFKVEDTEIVRRCHRTASFRARFKHAPKRHRVAVAQRKRPSAIMVGSRVKNWSDTGL
jgi:hypothetical protein